MAGARRSRARARWREAEAGAGAGATHLGRWEHRTPSAGVAAGKGRGAGSGGTRRNAGERAAACVRGHAPRPDLLIISPLPEKYTPECVTIAYATMDLGKGA